MTEILGTAQNPTNLSKTTEALQGPEEFFLSDYNIDSFFLKKKSILCWASIPVPTSPVSESLP